MTLDQVFSNIAASFKGDMIPIITGYVITFSPLILAALFGKIFWDMWMRYVHAKYFLSQQYSVIEIRLPKEMSKSPLAMELFLNSFHNTADGNWYKQLWLGETRPWFSLEMVSIEGQV